ncbi:hypothetical protein JCGZ_21056 [Jatropha curcas]|uniref:Uncharacterized protein n=1 Tax=Jatropha curcas TaxID=180498 RepID=A0A067JT71_JATCU|nr:hypothetical protein JCGZ_21056 [Jatropha curcas]
MAPSNTRKARSRFKKQEQEVVSRISKDITPMDLPCSWNSEDVQEDGEKGSSCSTPKAQRFKIPKVLPCPPAPMKRRRHARDPPLFFLPPLIFPAALSPPNGSSPPLHRRRASPSPSSSPILAKHGITSESRFRFTRDSRVICFHLQVSDIFQLSKLIPNIHPFNL